jgi:hypothetical protein
MVLTLTVQNCPLPSLTSGQNAHLHITIGFATTPPSPSEPEAGLRGKPLAEATRRIPNGNSVTERFLEYVLKNLCKGGCKFLRSLQLLFQCKADNGTIKWGNVVKVGQCRPFCWPPVHQGIELDIAGFYLLRGL